MKAAPQNTGNADLTNIMKLRRWGTMLIKAGQRNRDPHMFTAGVKLHLHSHQKLGVPHDGDNTDLGTQSQPQLGTDAK